MVRKAFLAELLILLALLLPALTNGPRVAAATFETTARITISARPCTHAGVCPFGELAPTDSSDGWVEEDSRLLGFYYAGSNEIVLPLNYKYTILLHEECHSREQTYHIELLPTTPAPWGNGFGAYADLALYSPEEVQSEDAANTCAVYQLQPDWLKQVSPERYAWADKYK